MDDNSFSLKNKYSMDEILEVARRLKEGGGVYSDPGVSPEADSSEIRIHPDVQTFDQAMEQKDVANAVKSEQIGAPQPGGLLANALGGIVKEEPPQSPEIGPAQEGGLLRNALRGVPTEELGDTAQTAQKSPDNILDQVRQEAAAQPQPRVLGIPLPEAEKAVSRIRGKSIPNPQPKRELASQEEVPDLLQDIEEAPKRERYNSLEDLKSAQEGSNMNQLIANMIRSGTQVGAAIGGTKADYSGADNLLKTANTPMEMYKAQQAARTSDLKLNENMLDLDNQEALQDPNHPISKAAREAAGKLLKIQLPDDVSAAQLDKAGLLKSLISGLGAQGRAQQQVIRSVGADGRVKNVLVNRLTGEMTDLGEAGYAAQSRVDPLTGELIQIIPSRIGESSALSSPGEPKPDPSNPRLNVRQQEKADDAIKRAQGSEEFKSSEKTLTSTRRIRQLLQDAKAHGGQSLSMLGPLIAKGIAGEVGVLTEGDVTRYMRNPAVIQGLQDTMMKITQGKLSEVSYENLTRLLDLVEKDAELVRKEAYNKSATQLNRNYQVPLDQANYVLNPNESAPSASGQAQQDANAPSGLTTNEQAEKNALIRKKLFSK